MLALENARERLLSTLVALPAEPVPVAAADGRVAAADVYSPRDLPPFDNSAMDGYAVRSADTATVPAPLRVVGRAAAGGGFAGIVGPGGCVRVFTGAPMPAGTDAVVMQEDVDVDPADPTRVVVREGVKPWEDVRFRGEDVRRGARIVVAGTVLGPQQVALLGATGFAEVTVHRAPRVVVLANGSELRPPGAPLGTGEIHESNTAMLAALVRRAGGVPVAARCVPDDAEVLRSALAGAFAVADVVVTVGGASVGEHDLVKAEFTALGGELEFWRLALKPGKPFFFGRHQGKFLFGLPGNPVSAFVTSVLLVLPALRRLQGIADHGPPSTPGTLEGPLSNPDGRRHFVRVATDADGMVRASGAQASHLLGSLAAADGLVDVPPRTTLAAGTAVRVIRW